MVAVLLLAVLGAVLSRWNSGPQLPWWKPGHTVKRVVVAGALGVALFVLSGDPRTFAAGLLLYFGLLMPWAQFQNFSIGAPLANTAGMALIGGAMVALPTAYILQWSGYDRSLFMVLAGALVGPAYFVAWRWFSNVRLGGFIDGLDSLGELARGFLIFGTAAWAVS